ncbi:MAG: O-methyltransferase, partial [Bdellovibrionales bacterium]|nr:O-methyltransferase [Bdellovibrionales bacterium]
WSGAKKVVEVGTLFGYSTLWMARGLGEEGHIITLEKDPERHEAAKNHFKAIPEEKKVSFLCGDAENLLKEISSQGPFDFVFIDANKGAYLKYLDWAEENVQPGGFIVGDNTFLFGGVYSDQKNKRWGKAQVQAMKDFNHRLSDTTKYQSCLIPTLEGMTVARLKK